MYRQPCPHSHKPLLYTSPPSIILTFRIQRLPVALFIESAFHVPLSRHPYALSMFPSVPILRGMRLVFIFFRRYRRSFGRVGGSPRKTPCVPHGGREHHVRRLTIYISGGRRHHSRPAISPRPPGHLRHLILHPRVFLPCRATRPVRAHLAWAHEDVDRS